MRPCSANGVYMKPCSGNGPAVFLMLLLASSPTFFPNSRDIRSCSLDVIPLQHLLSGYLLFLGAAARLPALFTVISSENTNESERSSLSLTCLSLQV